MIRGFISNGSRQWELMRVTRGTAFLVAVDAAHARHTGRVCRQDEASMSPAGFARGFRAPTDEVEVHKCTGIYNRNADWIRWDDPDVGIEWPLKEVRGSDKDRNAQSLRSWLAALDSRHFNYEPSAVFSR